MVSEVLKVGTSGCDPEGAGSIPAVHTRKKPLLHSLQ